MGKKKKKKKALAMVLTWSDQIKTNCAPVSLLFFDTVRAWIPGGRLYDHSVATTLDLLPLFLVAVIVLGAGFFCFPLLGP